MCIRDRFKCAGNVKLCLPWVDVSHYFDQRRRRLCFLRLEAPELNLENCLSYRLVYEVQMCWKCQIMSPLGWCLTLFWSAAKMSLFVLWLSNFCLRRVRDKDLLMKCKCVGNVKLCPMLFVFELFTDNRLQFWVYIFWAQSDMANPQILLNVLLNNSKTVRDTDLLMKSKSA